MLRFTKKLPVHTTYFTVFKQNGLTNFRKDVYEYDAFVEESQKGGGGFFHPVKKNTPLSSSPSVESRVEESESSHFQDPILPPPSVDNFSDDEGLY